MFSTFLPLSSLIYHGPTTASLSLFVVFLLYSPASSSVAISTRSSVAGNSASKGFLRRDTQSSLSLNDPNYPTGNPTGTPKICDTEATTPEVWRARNTSGFLKNYPNGKNLSISDFANQNGVYNFVCGIGETCNAGQLCAPIPGSVWHVLYAIQNWNNIQESISKAVTFAASTLDSIGSQLSIDLWPPPDKKPRLLFKIPEILALIVTIMAAISAVIFFCVPGVNFMFVGIASGAAAVVATAQATLTIEAKNAYDNMKSDAFSRWATYTDSISSWKTATQNQISDSMARALGSGISDAAGFGGLLSNGSFFTNTLSKTTFDVENAMTNVVKNAFVTVNNSVCQSQLINEGGPGGAFKLEDGWLSWCKDGKMMNLIYANGDKSGNHIYNAAAIPNKYNITVEYMTTQSENCQKKFGGFSHDPYNGTLPIDINADCIFNLPVCYPSADKKIRKTRRNHGTVVACRKDGGLPI